MSTKFMRWITRILGSVALSAAVAVGAGAAAASAQSTVATAGVAAHVTSSSSQQLHGHWRRDGHFDTRRECERAGQRRHRPYRCEPRHEHHHTVWYLWLWERS